MDPTQQNQQQGGGDASKIEKKFDTAFGNMVSVFKGLKNFKPVKLKSDVVSNLVDELLEEREQEAVKKAKEKFSALIDKKLQFDKDSKKAEDDYKKLVLEKKKAFTAEIEDALQIIADIGETRKAYESTLNELKEGDSENQQQAQQANPE